MQLLIQTFNEMGWLANLLGIASFIGGCVVIVKKLIQPRLLRSRIDNILPKDFDQKWNLAKAKDIATIAIVDDQPGDFPTTELKSDGYKVQVYKQVSLALTSQLALYDIVFLDMKGIVKDDPENGGLKLIAELRRINSIQKICAVSSKTFDINATEFFRKADDAKKKPLTAQECRNVITAFLEELFSEKTLRIAIQEATKKLEVSQKIELNSIYQKFKRKEISIDQLRTQIHNTINNPILSIKLINALRAAANASQ
jgi:CheY-like chemotaxis protein